MDFDLNELLPDDKEQERVRKRDIKKEKPLADMIRNDQPEQWLWNGQPIEQIPDQYEAFVYLFTNKITGKQYIGFKTVVSSKIRTVKGKRKRIKVESNWKTYYSSSQDVLRDVAKYGKGNFIREIIMMTSTKSVGKYYEAWYQFNRNVLTSDHQRYYNGIVNLRVNHNTLSKWALVQKATKIIGDDVYLSLVK